MRMRWKIVAFLAVLLPVSALAPGEAQSLNATRAEAFITERPTLLSLGFEWHIAGDDNRNAAVAVTYRKKGESRWRDALPMMRLQREQIPGPKPHSGERNFYLYAAPNMFAGSILGLTPDTEYECRFVLTDPDGVTGTAEQSVTVRTRAKPTTAGGGHVYHVYPFGFKGPMQQPAFFGLMAAYYYGSDETDHYNAEPPRVVPGDVILVHAGLYQDQRFKYFGFAADVPAYGTPFDGTYYLTQSGTQDKPITIKAAGDGEVIFDGDGAQTLFNMMAANYNSFEGVTVRNTNVAFLLGIKNIAGASGFSLTGSRLQDVGHGVQSDWAASRDFYIADNVFIGRHNPTKLESWYRPDVWGKFPGFPALTTSEYAVKVYGQGHVVAHNYVANFHDAIDVATYGAPSDRPEQQPASIDFYGNDMYNIADNCIEADGGQHNIRIFENRCFNSTGAAFSTQPSFGGPVYIYRNLAYDLTTGGPLKLLDTSAGVLVYQNTFVGQGPMLGPVSNVHLRNNLFVGDGWKQPVFDLKTFTNYSTSDYNGFGANAGAAYAFGWASPDFATAADFSHPLVRRSYATLADYQKATVQDKHSLAVTLGVFRNVQPADEADPQRLRSPEDYDFRLKAGSAAIDKGAFLPTITDGFAGRAPDLGAYELNQPLPHYGPTMAVSGATALGAPRSVAGPAPGK